MPGLGLVVSVRFRVSVRGRIRAMLRVKAAVRVTAVSIICVNHMTIYGCTA